MTTSFIFGTRNDSYGGGHNITNMLGAIESITRLMPDEIIIGEWNPPKDKERIADIIKKYGYKKIKVVTFPKKIQRLLNSDRVGYPEMNFYEFVIKHFCALQATSDSLIFTNVDNVFLPTGWENVVEQIKTGIGVTGCRFDVEPQLRPLFITPHEYVDLVISGITGRTMQRTENYGPFGDFYAILRSEYLKSPYQLCHKNEFVDCEIIIRSKSYKIIDYATVHFKHPETGGLGKPGRPYGDHNMTPPQMISDSIVASIPHHITVEEIN